MPERGRAAVATLAGSASVSPERWCRAPKSHLIDPLNRLSALSFLTAGSAGETAFDGFVPAASTTRAVDNAATTTRSLFTGRIIRAEIDWTDRKDWPSQD